MQAALAGHRAGDSNAARHTVCFRQGYSTRNKVPHVRGCSRWPRRIVVDKYGAVPRSRHLVTITAPPDLVEADQVDAMLDEVDRCRSYLDRLRRESIATSASNHERYVYRGLSIAEAAEILRIRAGTVQSRTRT